MSAKKKKSPWIILAVIALGIICGSLSGTTAGLFGITFYSVYDLIGKLFINSLMLIVVPLVSSSIIMGIARIGNDSSFGRLGLKMFSFYTGTTLLAILVGLFFVNLFSPGIGFSSPGHELISPEMTAKLQQDIGTDHHLNLSRILLQIVPSNIVEAFRGNMLGVIFCSLFFGYAISKVEKEPQSTLLNFFQGVFQAMLITTELVMYVLPVGVFCLVAKSFSTAGVESLGSLALFAFTVVAALVTFALVVLPILLKVIGKVSPRAHFRAMGPALLTAFSTSSSSATLPITMECVEKRAGVSNRICSLVVPLGTSLNMSGSALYECVAAIFIAQVYGLELSFLTQISIVILSLVTSMGVAGIPSASIVAIIIILNALGLPAEAIGLLFAVERILDMGRAVVNVFSDSCCAVLVARLEGETDILKKKID